MLKAVAIASMLALVGCASQPVYQDFTGQGRGEVAFKMDQGTCQEHMDTSSAALWGGFYGLALAGGAYKGCMQSHGWEQVAN